MKVLTLKPVRLNGKDESEGKVVEIPDDLAKIWCNPPWNLATTELQKPDPKPEPDQPEDEFPKHVGGGYYILPDGSKVHGKQAALDALAELNEGD